LKAIVIDGPGRAALRDVEPDQVGPNDVGVRILATGICGTDIEILNGNMTYYTTGAAKYPIVPGHEWVGEVAAIHNAGSNFSVGDRVVGEVSIGCMNCGRCRAGAYHRCAHRTETGVMNRSGGFAERIVMPARFVHRVSRSVSIESAALVEPTAVALNGILRAAVSADDYVAIFGDGPIGLLLLQVVRSFSPARVTMVGATELRLALAAELGADAVIDARKEDIPARLREDGCGELPSVILEATGNARAVATAIHSVAPGGRIVLQGLIGASSADGIDLDHLVVNDIMVCGALGSPNIWPRTIELIESGAVDPSKIVTDRLPLSEFGEGIRRAAAREAIKTILTPGA
jgi:L-iditol 2-dehydrogenase